MYMIKSTKKLLEHQEQEREKERKKTNMQMVIKLVCDDGLRAWFQWSIAIYLSCSFYQDSQSSIEKLINFSLLLWCVQQVQQVQQVMK